MKWNLVTDELPSWDYKKDDGRPDICDELVIVRLVRTDEYGFPAEPEEPIYLTAKMKMGWSGDNLYFHFREGSGVEFECLHEDTPNDSDLYPSVHRGKYSGRYYQEVLYMIHSWILVSEFEEFMQFPKIEVKVERND